jgi:hypothetical protein
LLGDADQEASTSSFYLRLELSAFTTPSCCRLSINIDKQDGNFIGYGRFGNRYIPTLQRYGMKIHDFSFAGSRFFHGENKEKICPPPGGQIFYEKS